jgi:TP901 family phage tail tape measure protein
MAKNTVTIKILGDASGANKTLDETNGKLAGLGGAAAKGAGGVAAGGALIGAALFKVGSDLDSAYDTIIIGTGASGDALASLKDDFAAVASSVPASFGDVGKAIADVNTRLGLTGKPLQEVSGQLLELSRLTGTDLGTNIETVTRAFGDWGVETGDMSGRLDQLFKASQLTGPSVDRLAQLATQFGGPMRQLGFSFEDTVALLGKFEKEGVNTELVMGSMRIALGKMARAGEDPAATFARVTDEIKNAGSAGEANAMALELFGAKAGPDMAAAIREGRFEIGELLDQMGDSENAIGNTAKATEDWREKLSVLTNRVMLKLGPLAAKVFDGVGKAVEAATPYIEQFSAWVEDVLVPALQDTVKWVQDNWPKVQEVFRQVTDFLQVYVMPIVQQVMDFIEKQIGEVIAWVEQNWPKIQETFRTVMDWIEAYITTVLAIYTKLWELFGARILAVVEIAWGYVKGVIENVMKLIKGVIEVVMGIITLDWDMAWGGIKKIIDAVWSAIILIVETAAKLLGQVLIAAWDGIKYAVGVAWEAVKSVVSGAVSALVGYVTGIPGRIGDSVSTMWDGIKSGATGAKDWVRDRIDDLVGFVTGIPGRVSTAVGDGFKAIPNAFKSAINGIIDAWNGLSFRIKGGPWDPLGSFGPEIPAVNFGFDTPNINRLAKGGLVKATPGGVLANIGEGKYDEAVIPLKPGWETMLDSLASKSSEETPSGPQRNNGGRGANSSGIYVEALYAGTTTEEVLDTMQRLEWLKAS